jgi:hypothetical protein
VTLLCDLVGKLLPFARKFEPLGLILSILSPGGFDAAEGSILSVARYQAHSFHDCFLLRGLNEAERLLPTRS